MSVIGSNILAGASGQGGEYTIDESLRFNASQSSYLSWTPSTTGNRKTWTWSAWVKRGTLATRQQLFSAYNPSNSLYIEFVNSTDTLRIIEGGGGTNLTTTQVFRDSSAWYHIVVAWDTTQATASNRVKIYLNGSQITSFGTSTYPTLNLDGDINNTILHNVGCYASGAFFFDGYITEVNFIDGQALDASSFGEFDSVTGVWKPAKYTGTYGNNGFYLPMQLDNTVEGFNTVTWRGNGSTQKITGVGFSPSLVWIKNRSTGYDHELLDVVRGATKNLKSNQTSAEATFNSLTSFDSDGFTVGSDLGANESGAGIVAWCWDAGSSTVSNTDGSITSSVRANPAYGFSVVTFTGDANGSSTVGHGLGVAPDVVIVKRRDVADGWPVYHSSLGVSKLIELHSTSAEQAASNYWGSAITSTTFGLSAGGSNNRSGSSNVAYCFSEVDGFSKFGSYTGTGSAGLSITTGFKPAFVMIKRTDAVNNWVMVDATRDGLPVAGKTIYANASNAEADLDRLSFTDTGFTLTQGGSGFLDQNASGGTYIYMAFKDTREYAYWLDDSGNNNDWQPNGGITTESTVTDTPTPYADGGNYCTLNPLDTYPAMQSSVVNGNLELNANTASGGNGTSNGTIAVNSGKWYFEAELSGYSGSSPLRAGWNSVTGGVGAGAGITGAYKEVSSNQTVIIAVDLDNLLAWVGSNGSWDAGNPSTGTGGTSIDLLGYLAVPFVRDNSGTAGNGGKWTVNFGQRPFAYTPPTGFLPLHTGNLPDSAIVDGSEYFNPVLYTGNNGSNRAITGVGFAPDLVWLKCRSSAYNHRLVDKLQGVSSTLASNLTSAAVDASSEFNSLDSDGFTITQGSSFEFNANAQTYVAWNWKANGAGVSNTDGSITSTVSANPTAGFSIVTYTGTGSVATVGHGLGATPDVIISKSRDAGENWGVYHKSVGATAVTLLNSTGVPITTASAYNNTNPTSAVFTVNSSGTTNNSGQDYVAYCFADVEGYSKFGSYEGNSNSNGPFIYCGFRPAWLMVKNIDYGSTNSDWVIHDSKRNVYNVADHHLEANTSNAEDGDARPIDVDFLSNGFKIRTDGSYYENNNTQTYIYMAFAENPFKNSLAR